jgi:hypothetical protein
MKPLSRREWWLPATYQEDSPEDRAESVGIGEFIVDPYVKVREVLPGEITLSKRQLYDAITEVGTEDGHLERVEFVAAIWRALLPEGTHDD